MSEPALFMPAAREWWPDTKEDWRAVSIVAKPGITDAEFEKFWAGFQAMKVRMRGERRRR